MNEYYAIIGLCGFSAAGGAFVAMWIMTRALRNFKWAADDRFYEMWKGEYNNATEFMDRFVDGRLIRSEGPCVTPDGRDAFVESFRSTPMARYKHDESDGDGTDEYFDARECYSSQEAYRMEIDS